MAFIVRLQTSKGVKRLLFDSGNKTVKDLRLQIKVECGVDERNQTLSFTPRPNLKIFSAADSQTLTAAGLAHGAMLHLIDSAAAAPQAAAAPTSAAHPASKLTARCMHGPHGRCVHCCSEEPGMTHKLSCNHGPNATCPACASFAQTKEKDDAPAPWLCNHPDTAFCPLCIPKEDLVGDEKKKPLRCGCNKAKGQQCLHCMDQGAVIKVNFVPYKFYMKEKKALCHYAHAASQTCASCADPVMPDYKGKPNCPRGHRPWPHGVCLSCAPPNVVFRLQKYRHCDTVSFQDRRTVEEFYRAWVRTGTHVQKAAILFGRYTDEPDSTQLEGAVRANVYAVYVPPQEQMPHGVRFLADANERNVHAVASAAGLEPVGWMMATEPREGERYGGKVFLSGGEVRQAALFQNKYKDALGHSRFVTVVVEHGISVEPHAFQVSDQCVALERDGVLAAAEDPYLLGTRVPKPGELLPPVVYKDKPLLPGAAVIPDECIVKCIVTAEKSPRPLFTYAEFATPGSEVELKQCLSRHARDDWHVRLSDFGLLCFLPKVVGVELAVRVAEAVGRGRAFDAALRKDVEKALTDKRML